MATYDSIINNINDNVTFKTEPRSITPYDVGQTLQTVFESCTDSLNQRDFIQLLNTNQLVPGTIYRVTYNPTLSDAAEHLEITSGTPVLYIRATSRNTFYPKALYKLDGVFDDECCLVATLGLVNPQGDLEGESQSQWDWINPQVSQLVVTELRDVNRNVSAPYDFLLIRIKGLYVYNQYPNYPTFLTSKPSRFAEFCKPCVCTTFNASRSSGETQTLEFEDAYRKGLVRNVNIGPARNSSGTFTFPFIICFPGKGPRVITPDTKFTPDTTLTSDINSSRIYDIETRDSRHAVISSTTSLTNFNADTSFRMDNIRGSYITMTNSSKVWFSGCSGAQYNKITVNNTFSNVVITSTQSNPITLDGVSNVASSSSSEVALRIYSGSDSAYITGNYTSDIIKLQSTYMKVLGRPSTNILPVGSIYSLDSSHYIRFHTGYFNASGNFTTVQ